MVHIDMIVVRLNPHYINHYIIERGRGGINFSAQFFSIILYLACSILYPFVVALLT